MVHEKMELPHKPRPAGKKLSTTQSQQKPSPKKLDLRQRALMQDAMPAAISSRSAAKSPAGAREGGDENPLFDLNRGGGRNKKLNKRKSLYKKSLIKRKTKIHIGRKKSKKTKLNKKTKRNSYKKFKKSKRKYKKSSKK